MGKLFDLPEYDYPNDFVGRSPGRKRNSKAKSHPKMSAKVKSDSSREVKHAVKAIMQFGDSPKAVSALPGDHTKNAQLIRKIIDECNAAQKDNVAIDVFELASISNCIFT